MKLALQLATGCLLLFWPMAVMFSPMAFDAPGSTSNKSLLLPLMIMVFYPALLGLMFYLLSWSFLFLSPRAFLIVSIALPTAAAMLFGYPRLVFNMYRGVSSIGYSTKPTAVYHNGAELEGADPTTFSVINEEHGSYARDRTHVYYEGKLVKGAEASSFTPLLDGEKRTGFWRDAKHVFRRGKQVVGADPGTFQVFDESAYARDSGGAYYQDERIEAADSATFRLLDSSFARDKARLYFLGSPILPDADIASFELLESGNYGRDAHRVYALPNALFANAQELAGADRETFTPLSRGYAKDASHVYYADEGRARTLSNADAATFKVTEWDQASQSEARDKHHYYLQGKVVGPTAAAQLK